VKLNPQITQEIEKISAMYQMDSAILEQFAEFVLANAKVKAQPKPPKPKSQKAKAAKKPTLAQLKESVFHYFGVADTKALKKSAKFIMSTSGMGISLTGKEGWESIYRKFIGILPGEDGESGYGCINGINIFKYSMPWKTFGLDPATASPEDIKTAYRTLSKIYHPDVPNSGDARVFERLSQFYQSLTERF
jgi:hypothetical protein